MSEATKPSEILSTHLDLLSEVHALFLEEGTVLRASGGRPDEGFLERKRGYLSRLDASLSDLRNLGGSKTRLDPDSAARVKEARNRLLQILMLDRENERLLLKGTVTSTLRQQFAPVLPGGVAKAYGESSTDPEKVPGSATDKIRRSDDSIRF
jgi:hypothetical protein